MRWVVLALGEIHDARHLAPVSEQDGIAPSDLPGLRRVQLDKVSVIVARLPTTTATESIVSGIGSTPGAWRGLASARTNPARSAPTSPQRLRPPAKLARDVHERAHSRIVEVSEKKKCGICTRFAHGPQVFLGREEAICKQRQPDRCACGAQVVPRPSEAFVDEDRDRSCALAFVSGRERGGIGVRPATRRRKANAA
jgi:hypothetical protein